MLVGGILAVYYDGYRRVVLERICEREEKTELLYQKKREMLQSVWLSKPALEKKLENQH